jgi:hypothetical protein
MKDISKTTITKLELAQIEEEKEIDLIMSLGRIQRRYFWKLVKKGLSPKSAWSYTLDVFSKKPNKK